MPVDFDHIITRLADSNFDAPAAFLALKRLEGDMKDRIHKFGEDSNNRKLRTFAKKRDPQGRYSKQHGLKRRMRNRNVDLKNLDFTSSLRNKGYAVAKQSDGRPALGFLQDRFRLIAGGQEEQTRQKIWDMSPKERENVIENYSTAVVENLFSDRAR